MRSHFFCLCVCHLKIVFCIYICICNFVFLEGGGRGQKKTLIFWRGGNKNVRLIRESIRAWASIVDCSSLHRFGRFDLSISTGHCWCKLNVFT